MGKNITLEYRVVVYSKASCTPTNDFLEHCKQNNHDLIYLRIRDSEFPQIPYDFEYSQVEELYGRKFYSMPIIFINEEYVSSLKEAYSILKREV